MNDEEKRLKIAYLTLRDAQDRRTWSGAYYYMAQALQKHCGEVTYIGPLDASKQMLVGKIINKSSQLLLKKNFVYVHSLLVAKKYAKIASQRLTGQHFDVIVAPAGAQTTAFLETTIPIVLVDDAPYALLYNYYPLYSNLLKRSVYEMDTLESLAIKRASLLLYASAWAAQSAVEDYHADRQKVHVIPFGANFDDIPSKAKVLQKEKSDRCRLLFVGVGWENKGGEIAFETLLKLEEMGIPAELTVCGCTPPSSFSHARMTVTPFLDKNDEIQHKKLEQLYMTSDFLLLPTRNDCTPNVCYEANAFGLPVIAADTGGVSCLITNGENGYVLPYTARGNAYAEVTAKIYRDGQCYANMMQASRAAFDARFNWDTWGITLKKLLSELLVRRTP